MDKRECVATVPEGYTTYIFKDEIIAACSDEPALRFDREKKEWVTMVGQPKGSVPRLCPPNF